MDTTPEFRQTSYQQIGDETGVRKLVKSFYDHMDDIEFIELRAMHKDMERSREHLFLFLSGWLGGPDLFMQKFGHPRLRQRHLPFSIGIKERNQWLGCMFRALDEMQWDEKLTKRLKGNFSHTADFMRNKDE